MPEAVPLKITGWHALAQSEVDTVFKEYVHKLMLRIIDQGGKFDNAAIQLFAKDVERGVIIRQRLWDKIDSMVVTIPA